MEGIGGDPFLACRGSVWQSSGAQTISFDPSLAKASTQLANVAPISACINDVAKAGTFSPNAVIAWRIAAKCGSECAIRAARFVDGTE